MLDLVKVPIIPVLVIEDVADALPLGEALIAGGLNVLEITLRTSTALDVIAAMQPLKDRALIGAGTVMNKKDAQAAKDAGSQFLVSPGSTDAVLEAASAVNLPILPGVSSPTEAMKCFEKGLNFLKFFPAQANGGAPVLRAWSGPLPHIKFCPTGGVDPMNVRSYLSLKNVHCVGGSWMAPKDLIRAKDWSTIESLAKQALALSKPDS